MSESPPPPPLATEPFFSPGQRRILAAALTLSATGSILVLLVLGTVQFGRLLAHFSLLLWPLAVAAILALLLQPAVDWLNGRLRLPRAVAVIVLYAGAVTALTSLAVIFVPVLVGQMVDFFGKVPQMWNTSVAFIQERFPEWIEMFDKKLGADFLAKSIPVWIEQVRTAVLAMLPSVTLVGDQVLGLFGAISGLAIIPVYLFFFLLGPGVSIERVGAQLTFLRPATREDVVFLAQEFIGIVVAFFRGQLLIGLIMGVLLAAGFTAVGLRFGLLIGLTMGLLNIVPYLGSILGLAVALPLALFQEGGGVTTLVLVLGVFTAVQAIEGWVLTPNIMGHSTGLHPVVIIVAIFFWGIALGGVLGMVLAIPLTAFFVTAWRLAKRKYFRPLA